VWLIHFITHPNQQQRILTASHALARVPAQAQAKQRFASAGVDLSHRLKLV